MNVTGYYLQNTLMTSRANPAWDVFLSFLSAFTGINSGNNAKAALQYATLNKFHLPFCCKGQLITSSDVFTHVQAEKMKYVV